MKSCTKCHTIKSLDQFGKKRAECKSCVYLRVKAWRSKQKTEQITTNLEVLSANDYDRFRAKVMDYLEKADRNARLADLVGGLTTELIAFAMTPAPAPQPAPAAEAAPAPAAQPVEAEPAPVVAEAQPSLEVEKLDAEEMYLLINEQDREYITGLYGKEAANFLKQRPGFAQALVSPVNPAKINDLYNKGYRQVYYIPPIRAPAAPPAEVPVQPVPEAVAAPAPKPALKWCTSVEEIDPECDGYLCAAGNDFWILNTEEMKLILDQREARFLPTLHPQFRRIIQTLEAKPDVRVHKKESWIDPDVEKIVNSAEYLLVEPTDKRVSLITGKQLKQLELPMALKYDDVNKVYLDKYKMLGYELPEAA